jgi:hypothetical protein
MEATKRIIMLLLLALLTTGTTQSAEKQAETISNIRTASCLVKITCDPAILPLNLGIVDYLLHSSGVGGKARREVLGITADQDYDLFTIEYVQPLASGGLGSYGLPPRSSRARQSSMPGDGVMDEYEYAMMIEEMEEIYGGMTRPNAERAPSPDTTKSSGLSSVVRSTSRTQPGTGRSSSTRRTTTSRTQQPTTGTSYGRRSRGRGSSSYGFSTISRAPQQPIMETAADPTSDQTDLFSLNVNLPEDVKPLAKEYMNALVENLREALTNAYDEYEKKLGNMLEFAESRRDHVQSRLNKAMEQTKATGPAPVIEQDPADAAVYERLEQFVNLSDLTLSMSFADVIEQLKTAVDPPLQIQPNWKDLLENAEVEQTTPAGMDPHPNIKIRKALEILLDGVSSEFAKLGYVVDEGVVLIATADSLPSKMVPRVYEIPVLAYSAGGAKDLIDTIQNTIDPESWFDMSDMGEATIMPYPSQQPRKVAILQTYENHQEIQKFLKSIKIDIPAAVPSEVPEEVLLSEKSNLQVEKQNLEMELARSEGRMPAIEEQIRRIKDEIEEKVRSDEVSEELKKILDMQVKRLEGFKKLADDGDINGGIADAEEKLARAKIELARRREQIGESAGADQLAKFSNEMATLAIDMAEKKAMLDNIDIRLNRIEQQLTTSTILDFKVSRVRQVVRALEIAERRINELNTLALNVQPPTVSVLGAE